VPLKSAVAKWPLACGPLPHLGRDAIDVSTTVKALAEMGVRVYCLALGGTDLTSSAGTMTMNVLNAVAQFERDLLIERTQFGIKRAKSEGKALGRPSTLSERQKQDGRQSGGEDINGRCCCRGSAGRTDAKLRGRHQPGCGEKTRFFSTYQLAPGGRNRELMSRLSSGQQLVTLIVAGELQERPSEKNSAASVH